MDLRIDLIDFKKPANAQIFQDNSENWLAFRKIRYARAGDGEFVIIRGLDLSGLNLSSFPSDHVVFIQCNLDGASFKNTEFRFETAFINCSMKNADLTNTLSADTLFLDCDLAGVKITPKASYTQWTSADLNGKDIPTVLSNCKLDDATKKFLIENKCIFDASAESINDKLERIIVAPILDL